MAVQLVGSEFLVNTTAGAFDPTITGRSDGRFVIAWGDASGDVRAQIFNADGSKFGGELLVNTTTADPQLQPTITALADGRFVVAWYDLSQAGADTSDGAVRAQVFDADGSKSGAEFLVNTTTANDQRNPAITALTDGRFVVAWSDTSDPGGDVRAQAFNADGSKSGGELLVNTTTSNQQSNPTVAALAGGRFVVAWYDQGQSGGDAISVQAQVFNADGSKFGGEFLVNSTAAGVQIEPTITALTDGRFVVAWTDHSESGGDTSFQAVRAQVFNADGSQSGAEFLVNTTTESVQNEPTITALADGRFVVAWTDHSQSGGDASLDVRAQVFNADGSKFEGELLVNTTTTGSQQQPTITAMADGRFVVSWTDATQDDVRAHMFEVVPNNPPAITSNGGDDTAAVSVAENSTLVTTVTASDPDAGQTLTYAIAGGVDESKFDVDPVTGALSFIAAPDFEAPADVGTDNVYDVTVQVSDGAGGADTQAIAVTVTDAANEAPIAEDDHFVRPPGLADVVVVNRGFAPGAWGGTVLFNSGVSPSSAGLSFGSGTRMSGVAVGDINGDGRPDTFTTQFDSGSATAWINDGGGTLGLSQSFSVPGAWNVAIGDLDVDGDADAIVSSTGNGIFTFFNNGSGSFAQGATLPGYFGYEPILGDLDADGDLDLFLTGPGGNSVLLNDGNGAFVDSGQNLPVPGTDVLGGAVGDLDGDGDLDAFTAGFSAGPAKVWLNDGSANFVDSGQVLGAGHDSTVVALGDVDGDGDIDAFVGADGSPNRVWLNNGSGVFSDSGQQLADGGNTRGVALIDYDGDGDLDALSASGGGTYVWANDGAGSFAGAVLHPTPATDLAAADLNPDGLSEDAVHTLDVLANDTDVDGSPLTLSSLPTTSTLGATLSVGPGGRSVVYNPLGAAALQQLFAGQQSVDSFTYAVSDGQGGLANATVTLVVDGRNDAPTVTSNGGDTVALSVAENTTAVTTVVGIDPDAGQTLTYSIVPVVQGGGADAPKFTINPNTGALSFVAAPDFEAPGGADNVYDVTVQVSDGNGGTDTQAIAVTVTNANEAPVFAGGDGKVTTAIGSADDFGRGLALQLDGKILVTGSTFNGSSFDFALTRYNADGGLDNGFGIGGRVITGFNSSDDNGFNVTVDADGKILVAGQANAGSVGEFALARYNADGSLDASFGSGGTVTTSIGPHEDIGQDLVVQPDGKILVSGYSFNGSSFDFAVVRYDADGSLDASFGSGGKVTTPIAFHEASYSIALQADGKIVAAGHSFTGAGPNDFAIVRYNDDGSLDASFGSGGKVTTDFEGANDVGQSVVIQPDGKIVVAGYSLIGANADFVLARYNADGTLDTAFDGDGRVRTSVVPGSDFGVTAALQTDGRILVAGNSFNGTNTDFTLVRYNADGSLDPTFGSGGKVTTQLGAAADEGFGVIVQPDGKILVSGFSSNGTDADFALVRYNADGSLDTIFGAPEVVTIPVSESTSSVTTLAATDPDAGQTLTYAIAGGADAARFIVDANTGALAFIAAPDFEAPTDAGADNVYDVTVEVSDGNGGTDTQAIAVAVTDANEAPRIAVQGNLDIVTTNYYSHNVSILLGDGSGGFTASTVGIAGGAGPASAALGDVNGDGNIDIVTANQSSSNISVLLGDGLGGFTATTTDLGGGINPSFVALADVNGDAHLDAVVANDAPASSVSILLGDGLGGFTASTVPNGGSNTAALAAGDVNGDGNIDIVTANLSSDDLSLLLGDGAGNFTASTVGLGAGVRPFSVALGDVNGDGKVDVVAANQGTSQVSVLLGDGTGGFVASAAGTGSSDTYSVALGDVNSDGKLDIVTANRLSSNVSILLGDGAGNFAATTTAIGTGANPWVAALGDLDGDGDLDIATSNQGSNNVSVLLGDGTGNFTPSTVVPVGANPIPIAIGHVNFDPVTVAENGTVVTTITATDPDAGQTLTYAIAGGADAGLFTIDSSTGALAFISAPNFEAPADAGADNVYDVTVEVSDGNGGTDTQAIAVMVTDVDEIAPTLLSITPSDPLLTSAAIVNYTVTFSEPVTGVDAIQFSLTTAGVTGAGITSVTPVAGSDGAQYTVAIDTGAGDGSVALGFTGSGVRDLAGNPIPGGTFPQAVAYPVGNSPYSVAAGDFDDDGKADLGVTNGGSASVSVLLGNGDGTFQPQSTFPVGSTPFAIAVSDVDGDAAADLIVTNGAGSSTVSVLLGNGDGTFQPQSTFTTGITPQNVVVGDVNADSKADLLVANQTASNVSVLLGNGDGTFQPQSILDTNGIAPQDLAVSDVDGDGKLDLLVTNGGSDTVSVLLGNGDGTFQLPSTYATGNVPFALAISDVDSDSNIDLLIANQGSGSVSVLLGNGDGTFQSEVTYAAGVSPFDIAASDVDSDGDIDILVGSEGTGTVSVLLGNGDGTFQPRIDYASGPSPFGIAVSDVDGDGRTDLLAANIGANTVSVLLSTPPTVTGPAYTIDKNDAPTITSNGGGETAPIAIAENTLAVTTVAATDPDAGQTLGFAISGGADATLFEVNPTTGVLSFLNAPDFEAPSDAGADNVYDVTVEVSDGNGGTDTQAIAVTVTNVAGITLTSNAATITGTGEEDTLTGLGGNNTLLGLGGPDTLVGGAGADVLDGGLGADAMSGGTGSDTYFVDDQGDTVIELSGQGSDTVRTTLNQAALSANVEDLVFDGAGDFIGVGNDRANTITGGDGNDSLDGGSAADTLLGGGGDDTYRVDRAADTVAEAAGGGIDTVEVTDGGSYALSANVENLIYVGDYTGIARFNGTGNGLANALTGGGERDTLSGQGGDDLLIGHGGDDELNGGAGIDTIEGGAGNDTMAGGGGEDTFVFKPGFGNDRITGFDANPSGGQDLIELFGFGITAADFAARVAIADVGANTLVTIDGAADQTILLAGIGNASTITVDDFRFV